MIAVFLNNIVPYHHARWNAYASLRPAECLLIEITNHDAFRVLQMDRENANPYRRVTLFPDEPAAKVSKNNLRHAVYRVLNEHRPDLVCLNGYSFLYNWAALDWCCRNNVPALVCSESNEFDEPRKPWKEAVKRFFIRHCAAGLAGGRPQADYLVKLGLPARQIFTGYDVVDNDHFAAGAAEVRSQEDVMRKKLALPSDYFLTCSRFSRKKNIPLLVKAYARYRELAATSDIRNLKSEIWDLVLVGDGEEKTLIEKAITENGVANAVHLVGAKTYDELPAYYGLASVFIHASTTEQWGLVVNEAMASGLPVLVSNRCGCAPDLVREGVNGFTFDPCDLEEIAQRMLHISTDKSQLSSLGSAGRDIIAKWSPQRFAEGLSQAAEVALSRPPPPFHGFNRLLLWIFMHR